VMAPAPGVADGELLVIAEASNDCSNVDVQTHVNSLVYVPEAPRAARLLAGVLLLGALGARRAGRVLS